MGGGGGGGGVGGMEAILDSITVIVVASAINVTHLTPLSDSVISDALESVW